MSYGVVSILCHFTAMAVATFILFASFQHPKSIAKRDQRFEDGEMRRSNDFRHYHHSRLRLRFCFHRPCFFVSTSSSVFPSRRERRGTLWSSTDVHRDLGWISVSVYRCRRVWEARQGQRGLVAKVGKRFIRPRELPNYTRSH